MCIIDIACCGDMSAEMLLRPSFNFDGGGTSCDASLSRFAHALA